jgi:hypothetical protein
MVLRVTVVWFVLVCLWFNVAFAQSFSTLNQAPSICEGTYSPRWNYSLGIRKYINSFTSYQFPNPFPPGQDPLSRLEFPIDQWFMGLSAKYDTPWWALTGEIWFNVSRESSQKMQDSDWDDESNPSQKTIFSESDCRLDQATLIDVGLALYPLYAMGSSCRPVMGYRYQKFAFTTHDGEQTVFGDGSMPLPGDGIGFSQKFNHFYFGALLSTVFYLGGCNTSKVTCDLQGDYALINARNEDLHLLREGNRVTTETTRGHCWHFGASATLADSGPFSAKIEADFKRLMTCGNHELTNDMFSFRFSFDGSTVWSDQAAVTAVGVLRF